MCKSCYYVIISHWYSTHPLALYFYTYHLSVLSSALVCFFATMFLKTAVHHGQKRGFSWFWQLGMPILFPLSLSLSLPHLEQKKRDPLFSPSGGRREREILGTSLLKKPLLCNPLHPEQIATVWMSLSGNEPTQLKTSLYMGPKKLMESQKTTPDRN